MKAETWLSGLPALSEGNDRDEVVAATVGGFDGLACSTGWVLSVSELLVMAGIGTLADCEAALAGGAPTAVGSLAGSARKEEERGMGKLPNEPPP